MSESPPLSSTPNKPGDDEPAPHGARHDDAPLSAAEEALDASIGHATLNDHDKKVVDVSPPPSDDVEEVEDNSTLNDAERAVSRSRPSSIAEATSRPRVSLKLERPPSLELSSDMLPTISPDDAAAGQGKVSIRVSDTYRDVQTISPPSGTISPVGLKIGRAGASGAFEVVPEGRYRLMNEIARGGMGRIILARDQRLDRPVAIKELLNESVTSRQRFRREALITARLQHPGIVNLYEAGCWESGEHFFAMERVRGESLHEVIDRLTTAPERLAQLPRIIKVAEALGYAHSQGVIHRDLKPENILVGNFGESIVIDWGLSKVLGVDGVEDDMFDPASETPLALDETAGLTLAGSIMGTPAYMPPEQAAGETVDERADVYAIGAILYHLLSGRAPFEGQNSRQILMELSTVAPPPLERLQPDLPEALCTIVTKAMFRDPSRRYSNAGALAEELNRFQTGKLVAAHNYTLLELIVRWYRRYRAAVSVGVIAALVLVVLAGVSFRQIVKARDDAEEKHREAEDALQIAQDAETLAEQRRSKAVEARQRALGFANSVALLQARSALEDDPTTSLAWLKRLELEGNGWSRARMIATDAWQRGVDSHVLRGHESKPKVVRFGRDDRSVISASVDGTLMVWGLDDNTRKAFTHPERFDMRFALSADSRFLLSRTFKQHIVRVPIGGGPPERMPWDDVKLMAVSASGERMVIALLDGEVLEFDPESDAHATLLEAQEPTTALAMSPDGGLVAVALLRGGVLLFDGSKWTRLPEDRAHIDQLTFSPDGRWLLSTSRRFSDETIRLIDLQTLKVHPIDSEETFLTGAFSPDSRWLALGARDSLEVFPIGHDAGVRRFAVDGRVGRVAFGESGRYLVAHSSEQLEVRDLTMPRELELILARRGVEAFALSSDGRSLATANEDRSIRVQSLAALSPNLFQGDRGVFHALAAPPGDTRVFAGDADGVIWSWNFEDPPELLEEMFGPIQLLESDASGRYLAALALETGLLLWRLPSLEPIPLENSDRGSEQLRFSANSEWMAIHDTRTDTVELWRLRDGTHRSLSLAGPARDDDGLGLGCARSNPAPLSFTSDGRWLAAAKACDETLRLWSLSNPDAPPKTLSLSGAVDDLIGVPGEESLLAVAGQRLWTVEPRTGLVELRWPERRVNGRIVFSPDGQWLAAALGHGHILVQSKDGETMRDLIADSQELKDMFFSPNGQELAVVGQGPSDIWDVNSGERRTLWHAREALSALRFLPDGRGLVSANPDWTVRLLPDDLPADPDALTRWIQAHTSTEIDRFNRATTPE